MLGLHYIKHHALNYQYRARILHVAKELEAGVWNPSTIIYSDERQ